MATKAAIASLMSPPEMLLRSKPSHSKSLSENVCESASPRFMKSVASAMVPIMHVEGFADYLAALLSGLWQRM